MAQYFVGPDPVVVLVPPFDQDQAFPSLLYLWEQLHRMAHRMGHSSRQSLALSRVSQPISTGR